MRVRFIAMVEIAAAFAGLFLFAALIGGLLVPVLPEAARMPVQALSLWGAVIAGGLLLRRRGGSYRELGLRRPESWRTTLGWAVAAITLASGGAAVLGALIQALTDWPPLDVGYIRRSIEGDVVAYVLWILLVVWGSAAFGEELFARGFLMDRLGILFGGERRVVIAAALGQAAIFGLLHAIQGPAGMAITFYVGLVLAGAYFASGRNLWAPILAHGAMDTISLTMMFAGLPLPGYID